MVSFGNMVRPEVADNVLDCCDYNRIESKFGLYQLICDSFVG